MKRLGVNRWPLLLGLWLSLSAVPGQAQPLPVDDLYLLTPGSTRAVNALWGENPLAVQFRSTRTVTVANLTGPGLITMVHFAYPEHWSATQSLNRELLLRIYWDGSPTPSVECPLVDFFCTPNGEQDTVNTAFVNVRRGYNAYFPMPFRSSARIELAYDGALPAGSDLAADMPCYSYVCYRSLTNFPPNAGYFCASWRQQALLLGTNEYVMLNATGQGKCVGWNVTLRSLYPNAYPTAEHVKCFIDGATSTSLEFQRLDDAFGFSWGFPPASNQFPLTGSFPFHTNGAAAYRFFTQDALSFHSSLQMRIGFGETETDWQAQYAQPTNVLQFSSTVYWYQDQPQVALPPIPPAAERAPAPMAFWPPGTGYAALEEFEAGGGQVLLCCGLPGTELVHGSLNSYSVTWDTNSYQYSGWSGEVYYCRASSNQFSVQLNLPAGARAGGRLRLYIIDPDNWGGGRKETIIVEGQVVGTFSNFQAGRWIEVPVNAAQTADGKVVIQVLNARTGSNAVLSLVEWIDGPVNLAAQAAIASDQLTLSWPVERLGWVLQTQTNGLTSSQGAAWVDLPGSAATNVLVLPLNRANGGVFYRLVYRGN